MSIFQFLDCCHKLTGKYYEPSLGHLQASCKDMNKVLQRLWWLFCISITFLSVKLKLARFRTKGIFSIICIDFPSVGRVLYIFHAQAFHLMEALCQWKHVNSTWIVTWFVDKTRQNCAWRNKNISKNSTQHWFKGCVLWKDLKQFRCLRCSRDFEYCEVLRKAKYSRKFKSLWHRKYLRWFKRLCPL